MSTLPLREEPLHPSLVRPVLLGGGERPLVILTILAIFLLLVGVGLHPITIGISLLLAFGFYPLLVVCAKADPQLSRVLARHIPYQRDYLARATPNARELPNPAFDSGL